ncbi:MAG: MotA/TolQ/ExbB proton channel family protein [Gemmataceae bacterium]|nr:MotA/TolQ/ExbB proton channel family protein [Gemmataceae bacterium]MCS7270733.1 MotA/TolQ/ExbB proton channel family protein [Gemmataceae bacterium]MDW8242819.1 MotA/TolQ/ExbB proton channel family protein [Thermogemmata sp.]
MKGTASHRPVHEWLLLFVALIIVGSIVITCWQYFGGLESREELARKWTRDRLVHLLLGPEQVACYLCFTWAGLILIRRYWEVRCQRRVFHLGLLPTEKGVRILWKDAFALLHKLEDVTGKRPYILAQLIRTGLEKFASARSTSGVAEAVHNRAEVEMSHLAATMAVVHYLVWAIPAIGFVGTVRGLGGAFGADATDFALYIAQAKDQLKIAFDCTLIALLLSLLLMFLLHLVQRAEETLVLDAETYCQEHMLQRLYEPQHNHDDQSVYPGTRFAR